MNNLQKIGMDSKSVNSEVSTWLQNTFISEMNKSLTSPNQEKSTKIKTETDDLALGILYI